LSELFECSIDDILTEAYRVRLEVERRKSSLEDLKRYLEDLRDNCKNMMSLLDRNYVEMIDKFELEKILEDLSRNYAEMVNNIKDTVNKAKESGYKCSELEATLEETKILEELYNSCQNIIDICQNSLLQLEYIGQHFDDFIKLAEGVKELLDNLSEIPKELVDADEILRSLRDIVVSFSEKFELDESEEMEINGILSIMYVKDLIVSMSNIVKKFVETFNSYR
jgi:succinate dehydrogenase/fumarate reductase-like Fe-S protein